MVLSLDASTLPSFERGGVQPVWLVEMYLGAIAYLQVLDYTAGPGATVTITADGSVIATYTEGVDFDAITSNAVTAENIAAAINGDIVVSDSVSAFAFDTMVVVHGYAASTRAQNATFVTTLSIATSASAAWQSTFDPVDRLYRFVSAENTAAADDASGDVLIPEIREVGTVAASIDPMSREFSLGDIEIVFDDPNQNSVIRGLLSRTFPKGRFVQVWVGTPDLARVAYLPVGGFFIDEVIPARGTITVTCVEVPSILRDKKFDNRMAPTPTFGASTGLWTGGSDCTFTLEVTHPGGMITRTYTEGVDFIGSNASQWATLNSLQTAINTDVTINNRVTALISANLFFASGDRLFIEPITTSGVVPVGIDDRATKISAVSSDTALLIPDPKWAFYSRASATLAPVSIGPAYAGVTNMHPVKLLRELYTRSGLDSSLIEDSSFDLASYPTIAHWGVSAHALHTLLPNVDVTQDNAFKDTTALDIQSRLCRMVQGGVVGTELGEIKFIRRDVTTPATRHLTSDDYDEIEWLQQYQTLVNSVSIYGTAFGDDTSGRVQLMRTYESFSQALQSQRANANPEELIIDEPMLGVILSVFPFTSADTTIDVLGAWAAGFSGCREETTAAGGGVASGEELDGIDRTGTFIVWRPVEGDFEYIEATAAATLGSYTRTTLDYPPSSTNYRWDATLGSGTGTPDDSTMTDGPLPVYRDWTLTVNRGMLGTAAIDYLNTMESLLNPVYIADATIAKAMADHYMTFAYGVPICKFRTTLRHYDLQLGDVITADFQQFLNFLEDGADTNTTWEIIGKELDFPWVRWTVARLARRFTPSSALTAVYEPPTDVVTASGDGDIVTDNDLVTVTDNDFNVVTRS